MMPILNRDEKAIAQMIKEKGKIYTLSMYAGQLCKRSYFTIDGNCNIKKTKMNMVFPVFAYIDDIDILAACIVEHLDFKENQTIKKIERFSNLDIKTVRANFIKTMSDGNIAFAKRYGKELFLRDSLSFYDAVSKFALAVKMESLKPLMVLAFAKMMGKDPKEMYTDQIFYMFICYMSGYRDDYYMSNNENKNIDINKIKEKIGKNSSEISIEVLSYFNIAKKAENNKNYLYEIEKELDNRQNIMTENKYEKMIHDIMVKEALS